MEVGTEVKMKSEYDKLFKLNYNVATLKFLAYTACQKNNINMFKNCFCKKREYLLDYKPFDKESSTDSDFITMFVGNCIADK